MTSVLALAAAQVVGGSFLVWLFARKSSSRMLLGLASVIALPGIGIPVALLAVGTRGRGAIDGFGQPPGQSERRTLNAAEALQLAEVLPVVDRLMMGDAEERSAALAGLAHLADADSIALLRWTMSRDDADLVLEATLTLSELTKRHEQRREEARMIADLEPSYDTAIAAADVHAEAIHTELVDSALVPKLAEHARRYYDMALAYAPYREREVAVRRAYLELAVGNPHGAQALVEHICAHVPMSPELAELHATAAFRARRLDAHPPLMTREGERAA
jgi:hypothetical protein